MNIPRPEYPRPQFERADWINLNGTWTYTFDFGHSGRDVGRELFKSKGFEFDLTPAMSSASPRSSAQSRKANRFPKSFRKAKNASESSFTEEQRSAFFREHFFSQNTRKEV